MVRVLLWWIVVALLVGLGAVGSRSRRTAQVLIAAYLLAMAAGSLAIYRSEVQKESNVDPAELGVFIHDNPWTPSGVVILFVIAFGLPWFLALVIGWLCGRMIRGRNTNNELGDEQHSRAPSPRA